jgi:hypothetical protein
MEFKLKNAMQHNPMDFASVIFVYLLTSYLHYIHLPLQEFPIHGPGWADRKVTLMLFFSFLNKSFKGTQTTKCKSPLSVEAEAEAWGSCCTYGGCLPLWPGLRSRRHISCILGKISLSLWTLNKIN